MTATRIASRIAVRVDKLQARLELLRSETHEIGELVDLLRDTDAAPSSIRRARAALAETRVHLRLAAKTVGKV